MIFHNPKGAPELACNECGCRWFDRMTNRCYECGADISARDIEEFTTALRIFTESRKSELPPSPHRGARE